MCVEPVSNSVDTDLPFSFYTNRALRLRKLFFDTTNEGRLGGSVHIPGRTCDK